ncbi:hypothetical protein [Gracilibacillus alcaliphilus]|uniref:hypothetical protein n=1 Tax=Gracilibacillus alcaliphilus TaxID=1401441 RepID=UPI00195D7AF1|nr:hypothetical protein [Gracilibacillus alcaliphilus]MBM7679237.1 hypothetical protein [Gracilibacillus alcaliphilus]
MSKVGISFIQNKGIIDQARWIGDGSVKVIMDKCYAKDGRIKAFDNPQFNELKIEIENHGVQEIKHSLTEWIDLRNQFTTQRITTYHD